MYGRKEARSVAHAKRDKWGMKFSNEQPALIPVRAKQRLAASWRRAKALIFPHITIHFESRSIGAV